MGLIDPIFSAVAEHYPPAIMRRRAVSCTARKRAGNPAYKLAN